MCQYVYHLAGETDIFSEVSLATPHLVMSLYFKEDSIDLPGKGKLTGARETRGRLCLGPKERIGPGSWRKGGGNCAYEEKDKYSVLDFLITKTSFASRSNWFSDFDLCVYGPFPAAPVTPSRQHLGGPLEMSGQKWTEDLIL